MENEAQAPCPEDQDTVLPPPAPTNIVEEETPACLEKDLQRTVQVVSINKDGTKFELKTDALKLIFQNVPKDMKVSIVSIVGAFRTGKSFLLDLFLRYLRYSEKLQAEGSTEDLTMDWIQDSQESTLLRGNSNKEIPPESAGFSWRAGKDRNTTGIWIWAQPFIRAMASGEKIAVFLMDTQGMFDSETSQMLTASIFGLSTLMSSYQIYNVDKRIQEDNLQHLALFTEYGRMALAKTGVEEDVDAEAGEKETKEKAKDGKTQDNDEEYGDEPPMRPFQKLEFLVRDWQNFDDEENDEQCLQEMKEYMEQVLATRTQKDLADTREQINACFEDVSAWLLPHPGFEIVKKNYDGDVRTIRPDFLRLVTLYVRHVFDTNLSPKKIQGRAMTATELLNYVTVYVNLFKDAQIFPEAKTLLEATAEGNNVNSRDLAVLSYKTEMDKIAGNKCRFVPTKELASHHQICFHAAMDKFDASANMGRRSEILKYRNLLKKAIADEFERYAVINHEKNPYKNIEMYILPITMVLFLYVLRVIQDLVCYDEYGYDIPVYDCKEASKTLTHLYMALVVLMLIMAITTGHAYYGRIKSIVNLVKDQILADIDTDGKMKKD